MNPPFQMPLGLPVSTPHAFAPIPKSVEEDDDDFEGPRGVTRYYTPPKQIHEVKIDPIDVEIQRAIVEYRSGYDGSTADLFQDTTITKTKTMILSGNGLWCFVKTPAFKLLHVYSPISFQAHHTNLEPKWELNIPKLPGHLLTQILSLFRHFTIQGGMDRTTEAMAQVYWDNNTQEYFINIPDQEVTGGGVHFNFELNDHRCFLDGVYKVFDIHSHNTMSSFFSGVDDRDEKESDQFFGVIGTIGADNHTWRWRFGVNGSFVEIPVEELVDLTSFTEQGFFPEAWLERIRFPKPVEFATPAVVHSYYGESPERAAWWDRNTGESSADWWHNRGNNLNYARTGGGTDRFYPKGTPPYGQSRGEWFKYFLMNLKDVLTTPKQVTKLLALAISGPMSSNDIMHRVRTLVGQMQSKSKSEVGRLAQED